MVFDNFYPFFRLFKSHKKRHNPSQQLKNRRYGGNILPMSPPYSCSTGIQPLLTNINLFYSKNNTY